MTRTRSIESAEAIAPRSASNSRISGAQPHKIAALPVELTRNQVARDRKSKPFVTASACARRIGWPS